MRLFKGICNPETKDQVKTKETKNNPKVHQVANLEKDGRDKTINMQLNTLPRNCSINS